MVTKWKNKSMKTNLQFPMTLKLVSQSTAFHLLNMNVTNVVRKKFWPGLVMKISKDIVKNAWEKI